MSDEIKLMHEKISLSNDSWILREISRNDFLSPNLAEKYLKPNPLPKEKRYAECSSI